VDVKAIEGMAKTMDAKFVKCSALTGEGVDAAFMSLSSNIIDKFKGKAASKANINLSDTVKDDTPAAAGCCG
jgi:hypothetical protein